MHLPPSYIHEFIPFICYCALNQKKTYTCRLVFLLFFRVFMSDVQTIYQQGGVIAYPTEAVFGLGCDPDNVCCY